MSLTARILFVNIIAFGLLAGSLFYLDSYRNELLAERFRLAREEVQIAASGLEIATDEDRIELMTRIGTRQDLRLRLFDAGGSLVADSFELAEPSYTLIDPDSEPWYQDAARMLDRGMDFLLGAPAIENHKEPAQPVATAWPEIGEAGARQNAVVRQRLAPDRTPVINAASPIGDDGAMLMVTRNARDITQNVRDARQTLAIVVGVALMVSILLSFFLGQTIVHPLRELVRAAVRVRLGRDRQVVVPRLPDRRDEIGLLARAISDMTAALRQRIDSVESFAADVSHELKNPLTSLRSALESLEKVEDPALRRQLFDIAKQDVERVDWLVTEIADASRIDAQLSRTDFEKLDMLALVTALAGDRDRRGVNGDCRIEVAGHGSTFMVPGDAPRIERVLHNLLDNAVSFSPPDAVIDICLERENSSVTVAVSDHGSGIPHGSREKVFERFHSLRDEEDGFARHSGLGLAIARTIVEAHFGTIRALGRADSLPGARIEFTLPAWEEPE